MVLSSRGTQTPVRLLALALCLVVLVGAGAPISLTYAYTAETVLFGEAVCPVLVPGDQDGSVIVRWISFKNEPVDILYAPDDGAEAGERAWETVHASITPSMVFTDPYRMNVYQAELRPGPGRWVYGLAPAGETPQVTYPLRFREDEVFRTVMSSDSHIATDREAGIYDQTILSALGEDGADLVIHTGDMNDDALNNHFLFGQCTTHTRSIPTLVVSGNHDRSLVLYDYLSMPHRESVTGDYWTIQGNILFIGLNVDWRPHLAHERYVRETIPAHREGCDWVVVLIHYSLMSSGYHVRDQKIYDLRKALAPLFQSLDVDLVLSGHDHMYCRSVLCAGEERIPDSGGEQVEKHPGETVYMTLPTATGYKFYELNPYITLPTDQVAVEGLRDARGYVTADFRKESIEFNAWNAETGERVDRFVLTRAA